MTAAVLIVLVAVASAVIAQNSTVDCSSLPWAFNAEKQSPCQVWAELSAICQPAGFVVPPLRGATTAYAPPSQQDPCQCNIAAFNLMSACSLCQQGITSQTLFNETRWRRDCTSYNTTSVSVAHPLVDIPSWAFMIAAGRAFQPAAASSLAVSATSSTSTTTSGTSAAITTSTPPPDTTISTDPTTAAQSTSGNHTGAIAGGVVGGVVALAMLALLGFLCIKRRRWPASKAVDMSPSRMMQRQPPEFGIPNHLQVQHFVPPASSTSSLDKLPRAAVHPYAANYAVQRNMLGLETSGLDPSPPPAQYQYPLKPVRGYSTTGNVAAQDDSFYPRTVASHVPSPVTPPSGRALGSHPFANPMLDDDYRPTQPLTPLEPMRRSPSPRPELPSKAPGSPLPPLRVPRPVRHYSNGTEFSPSSLESGASSQSPLVAASKGNGVLQPLSSIERMITKGAQVKSTPKSSHQDWRIE